MTKDSELSQVLQSWKVAPPEAPGFTHEVWRRIALTEQRAANGWAARLRDWFVIELPRPAYAAALVAGSILLSVVTANIRAGHQRTEERRNSAREYLASIDPIAMATKSEPKP